MAPRRQLGLCVRCREREVDAYTRGKQLCLHCYNVEKGDWSGICQCTSPEPDNIGECQRCLCFVIGWEEMRAESVLASHEARTRYVL